VTIAQLQEYGVKPEQAGSLTIEALRSMLGEDATPPPQLPGMAQPPVVGIAPSAPVAPSSSFAPPIAAVTTEREELEGMITGPILKAWRRGRKDIPGLNDEQLKEMIALPGGPPTNAQTAAPVAPPVPAVPPTMPPPAPAGGVVAQPAPAATHMTPELAQALQGSSRPLQRFRR